MRHQRGRSMGGGQAVEQLLFVAAEVTRLQFHSRTQRSIRADSRRLQLSQQLAQCPLKRCPLSLAVSMQFVSGSTRALACSDGRPRPSSGGERRHQMVRRFERLTVLREGAQHCTRGRVRSHSTESFRLSSFEPLPGSCRPRLNRWRGLTRAAGRAFRRAAEELLEVPSQMRFIAIPQL